jgi:hypothetical protein
MTKTKPVSKIPGFINQSKTMNLTVYNPNPDSIIKQPTKKTDNGQCPICVSLRIYYIKPAFLKNFKHSVLKIFLPPHHCLTGYFPF